MTAEGVEPDDGCIEALLEELRTRPRSRKMLQHLMGVILYSSGAFEWNVDDLTWWSAVMRPLHTTAAKERFQWTGDGTENGKDAKSTL